jgi:hypothetical protein
MPLFKGNKVDLDFEYILHRLRIDEAQSSRNRLYVQALKEGIPLVLQRARPIICYRYHAFSWTSRGVMKVDGTTLRVGEVVEKNLDGAYACCIGITTIGTGVEDEARFMKEKGLLYSFALEALAGIALDTAMEEYLHYMEDALTESGNYVGVPLSPGETVGWPIEDQRRIYELLEEELENVTITDSCLLIPKNSVSFLVGLFDYKVKEEGDSHCNYCSMREKCLYRAE